MAQSVDPILLDSTGQDMVAALYAIANKTVDSALSSISVNPVQNKVITGEINGIKEKIPSDASSSNKMATASDVTGLRDNVVDTLRDAEVIESNNLFSEKYAGYSIYGDSEGTYINTLTNGVTFLAKVAKNTDYVVSKKSGVGNRFRIAAFTTYPTIPRDDPETDSTEIANDNSLNSYSFNSGNYEYIAFTVNVTDAMSADSEAMIRVATEDGTYHPYYIPLKDSMSPRSEQAVLGAKNLFFIQNNYSDSGITEHTFTDTGVYAKSINAQWANLRSTMTTLKKNTIYKFSTDVDVVSGHIALTAAGSMDGSSYSEIKQSNALTSNGHLELAFNTGNYNYFRVGMFLTTNTAEVGEAIFSNLMLRLASDPDDTYVPYAMTNKELTELNTIKDITLNLTALAGSLAQTNNYLFKEGRKVFGVIRLTGVTANGYTSIARITGLGGLPNNAEFFCMGKIVGGSYVGFRWVSKTNGVELECLENLDNKEVMVYDFTLVTNA